MTSIFTDALFIYAPQCIFMLNFDGLEGGFDPLNVVGHRADPKSNIFA